MDLNGTSLLITGASGFIGRHMVALLLAHGARVRGTSRNVLAETQRNSLVDWVSVGEIGPETDWTEALRGVEVVIHLAALAHQTDPRHQPDETAFMAVNAYGTRRLAEAVARSGSVRRLIFVSSIGAVTESCTALVDETVTPSPTSPYGRSKLAGERAVKDVLTGLPVEWCVLRPVLVYGPGNPGNMARLLRLVRTGMPLPLGGIQNQRSFVYVRNLVDAIECVAYQPGISKRVFHVADDQAVSTPELIRIIGGAAGCTVRLWSAPPVMLRAVARLGDAGSGLGLRLGLDSYSLQRLESSLTVSNQLLKNATKWQPRASLAEGLRSTFCAEPSRAA